MLFDVLLYAFMLRKLMVYLWDLISKSNRECGIPPELPNFLWNGTRIENNGPGKIGV